MIMHILQPLTLMGRPARFLFRIDIMVKARDCTADHSSNMAMEMLQISEGKLEAHEHLNALKAGELYESAAYAERFACYKAQYAFPEEKIHKQHKCTRRYGGHIFL